jgi:ABC-type Mn2+/Zn2+ transport systems, permease components
MMEALHQPFFQRALVVAVVLGATTALLGTYVVIRGLAFIGAGIAHASFGGLALAIWLGWPPLLTAIGFSVAVGLGIGMLTERRRIKEDTAIGIFFASAMALGVVLLARMPGYQGELMSYLFGDVLSVGPREVGWILGFSAGILLVLGGLARVWWLLAYDPELGTVQGFPMRMLNLVFLGLLSLTVVLAMSMVGILLISAMLVLPPATAQLLAWNLRSFRWLAVGVGVLASVGGLMVAYVRDLPPGPTVVLVATALFFLAWVVRRLQR